jgi:hypothetical protein
VEGDENGEDIDHQCAFQSKRLADSSAGPR